MCKGGLNTFFESNLDVVVQEVNLLFVFYLCSRGGTYVIAIRKVMHYVELNSFDENIF